MEFKENNTMKDILNTLVQEKKPVDIMLKSGKEYKGKILKVGQTCILLQQVGSKSFFDSIIRIEDISAVDVQIRSE